MSVTVPEGYITMTKVIRWVARAVSPFVVLH
jgi:hypothetical protein